MFYRLQMHPESVCAAVSRIDVELTRQASKLAFRYVIAGTLSEVSIPDQATPQRTDGLWQHTCCEAFIGNSGQKTYYEFNFSPSTEWAAYRFNDYRAGMSVANEVVAPSVGIQRHDQTIELSATIDLTSLSLGANLRIGLSVVIEERSGRKSYWALAHSPGKPDFHHAGSFVLI
jgi:hypothetical protein